MRKLLLIMMLVLFAPASARAAQSVGIFYYPWFGAPPLDGSYTHWMQNDHTPPFDLGTAPQGQAKSIAFTKVGKFEIECAIHPEMKLIVTVAP